MANWRIRVNVSDDEQSRARLADVLADRQVSAIQLTPRTGSDSVLAGDVVLELPHDDQLGEMLTALHLISPHVFVSRAGDDHGESLNSGVRALAPADSPAPAD